MRKQGNYLIIKILKEQKKYLLILVFGSILFEFIKLLYPMILGKILDAITVHKKMELFVWGAISYVVVFIIEKLVYIIVTKLRIRVNEKVIVSNRSKILKEILNMVETEEKIATGVRAELVLKGAQNISDVLFLYLDLLTSAIKSIIVLFVLFRVNVILFIVAVVWLPIMFGISKRLGNLIKRMGEEKQKEYEKYKSWLVEIFSSLTTIYKYGMHDSIVSRTQEMEDTYQKKTKKSEYLSLKTEYIMQLMLHLLNISIYVLSAFLILKGKLTIGVYIMVFEYYYIVQNSISQINTSYSAIKEKNSLLDQVAQILKEKRETKNDGNLEEGIRGDIEFRNISFAYKPEENVLHDCSYHIEAGEEIMLVGKSGVGKSTLIKLIARIYNTQAGEILLSGKEISSYKESYLRKQVMFISQEKILLNGTIKENLTLGEDINEKELIKVLEEVDLLSVLEKLPQKLDTLINSDEFQLSEGEYQRLNIARVLLKKPRILMIDEGTSSLDIVEEEKLRNLIRKTMTGVTVLYISHREESAAGVPHIVSLENGKLKKEIW